MTIFNIGDTVYQASTGQEQIWITCPECLGSGRLRVILGDDSEVSIACVCCERGYEGSPGKLQTYRFEARTTERTVTGVNAQKHGDGLRIRYSFGCYWGEAENVFATREDAAVWCAVLVAEHEVEETKRLRYKEKNHKTWAWNVRYLRSGIRKAKEEIAGYEARLAVAPKNIKEADKIEPQETL